MAEDDTEYLKLPVDDRCVHKNWKARVSGYEEAKKIFSQITDEKSPEWNKFLGLMKKMVVDSNAMAQEKGLEAVLVYVENSAVAGKTVGEVMSGLVAKCVAAPKTKTKELAWQLALMYVEIEKQEIVLEELLKGTEQKNPKIVSACINIITQAIREFGVKVVNVKPLMKRMPVLLEDRDKTVRDETKALAVEIYRWIGVALNPQLATLKPVQLTELGAEFEKVKGSKAVPSRYLKSQQAKQAVLAAVENEQDGEDDECDDGAADDVDPYEIMVAVDVLSRLPKDWQEQVEMKKWQDRKQVLDTLDEALKGGPKLENGDYADLIRALKRMISKDSNVVVVALAIKCLAGIANGLKKRFQPYALSSLGPLLEKFKERKATVVAALREAVDAVFISTSLDAMQEDVLAALENKNPSVKAETASFLARCFTKSTPVTLNKKLLKAFCAVLLKTINEPDPTVRDASAEALGTAMKVVGEKGIAPFLSDVDKIKMDKIKEACEKAELQVKQPKAVAKKVAPAPAKPSAGSTAPKAVKRPVSAGAAKKPATKKSAPAASSVKVKPVERELTPEDVDEKAEAIFPPEMLSGLADSNWKTRLAAVEQFQQLLGTLDPAECQSQLLLRVVNKKPGLKDTNLQVAKLRLDAVKTITENFPVSVTGASCVATDVAEKLSDGKTQPAAAEALAALAEAAGLEHVAVTVLDYAMAQKNPKLQVEALSWLAATLPDFGLSFPPKVIMENVKKAVTAINPAVRGAGITLAGVLSLYMGAQLISQFSGEKAALLQLIQAEFDKHAGETPNVPVRGPLAKQPQAQGSWRGSVDTVLSTAAEEEEEPAAMEEEPEPAPAPVVAAKKVDFSQFVTEALINELSDKNWKVRAEAVQKLQNHLGEKAITSSLGELPPVLAARLVDSNTKIAASTYALLQTMGQAMGPACKHHVRAFTPNLLNGMGDAKSWIRTAAIACLNTWGEQCGFKEFFDGEMIADALKSGSPTLRSELWVWLAEKLPNLPPKSFSKEELIACIPVLLSNLEDRNADVRKNSGEAVLGVMMHTGPGPLLGACEKLKPGSQGPVKLILEKARGSLPERPVQRSKSSTNINAEKGAKAAPKMGPGSTATFTKKPKPSAIVKPGGRKKEEEVDCSSLLQNNNLKNQRVIDEQKLKTIKWNFVTPREEFVELLKEQMTTAGVSKALMFNMFHMDFKFHLKAIDSLSEDLASNVDAQRANLDLILRWMTLRFFDTNPSVLLRGLEYLQSLFTILIDNDYNMLENEAASFLPYLILKIGDPKDAVRNGVKNLLRQIWLGYPVSKLFVYLMDGIKSKNARQRSECLEHMGLLMENFGITVCQPTAQGALKEIAKQISDRDNSVRSAALNCIVTGYFLEGEKVLKMVGHISDKDMSLLEERIKRAAKNRPVASVKPQPQVGVARPNPGPVHAPPPPIHDEPEEEEEEEVEEEPPAPLPPIQSAAQHSASSGDTVDQLANDMKALTFLPHESPNQEDEGFIENINQYEPRPVTGPFGLDQAFLSTIESNPVSYSQPKLQEFDLSFLSPNNAPSSIPRRRYDSPVTVSPLAKLSTSMTLEWHLTQIGNRDLDRALDAMQHIENLLTTDQSNHLHQHEDLLVTQLVRQLEYLNQSNHLEIVNCYKMNLNLFVKLFTQHPELSRAVQENTLREAVRVLLILLTEKRLEMLESGGMFVRVINNVIIRILERSNHTSIVCALIKNLHDTVNNTAFTIHYQELLMKCIWKVIKLLEDWVDELQYNCIFVDIHAFLTEYPSAWWKKQPSDTPLRTIKTIMHTIVKLNGPIVEDIVRNVRGVTRESELWTYVQKLLKHLKVAEIEKPASLLDNSNERGVGEAPATPTRKRLSKSTHDQLSDIFFKIGHHESTTEGLQLLYDFKHQHTDADINPFLQKSSKFFQDYIARGLKQIETDRRMAGYAEPTLEKEETVDKDSDQYLKRLRAWQVKAGWNDLPAAATLPTPLSPPRPAPASEPDVLPLLDLSGESRDSAAEQDVEALRKRLDRLKSSLR